MVGVDLHAFIATDTTNYPRCASLGSSVKHTCLAEICMWQLSIAVRVLGLMVVNKPWLFDQAHALLLVSYLMVFLGECRHLIRIHLRILVTLRIVADYRLHWLLVILASVVAILMVSLDI